MPELETLAVVALVEDLPEKGLRRGQVGTVVENLAPSVYEVEFSDDHGRTYASVALTADQLMRLHHEPKHHDKCVPASDAASRDGIIPPAESPRPDSRG